jgi:SAM-dependent methyltransferase
MKILISFVFFINTLIAEPPRNIPEELNYEYTMGSQIPVREWYFDNSYSAGQPIVYRQDEIAQFMDRARAREMGYYGNTDAYLYSMLTKYLDHVEGKKIGIIGSTIPWYESIILAFGGHPVTIEYNKIICEDPRLQVMTVEEFKQNPMKFDAIVSISSIEHDGLGRYGDPINPWGDIEAMQEIKKLLKPGGLFFLAVPVGKDLLVWNAHRVYGVIRLPLLLAGWEIVDSSGFAPTDYSWDHGGSHQPVFVLRDL